MAQLKALVGAEQEDRLRSWQTDRAENPFMNTELWKAVGHVVL